MQHTQRRMTVKHIRITYAEKRYYNAHIINIEITMASNNSNFDVIVMLNICAYIVSIIVIIVHFWQTFLNWSTFFFFFFCYK